MGYLAFDSIILFKIIAAIVFGFGLGLERELTNKYAGLRTHILVCLGSCIFTILSIHAFPLAVDQTHPQAYGDPARIAAQILTGIGFIGGGTVLRHGSSVSGLTTAATLWVAAAIGMACGAGMVWIALVTTIFSVSVLVLIRIFEKNVLVKSTKNVKKLTITINCLEENVEKIYSFIIESFDHMYEISKKKTKDETVSVVAIIEIGGIKPIQKIYEDFDKIEGIDSISIKEYDE